MTMTLNRQSVEALKKRIWEGASQQTVAEEFNISQGAVSKIVNGHTWDEVRWPNGEQGPFPLNRRMKLLTFRYSYGKRKETI